MKKGSKYLIIIGMILITGLFANQGKWNWELRTGISTLTTQIEDSNFGPGLGFEGIVSYGIMPHLSVYTGWGWNKFSAGSTFAGEDIDLEETGYVLGFQFLHPIEGSDIEYFARLGAIAKHLELENSDGKIIADSGHGTGYEFGGGLVFPLKNNAKLMTGLKYQSLRRDIELGGIDTRIDLNAIGLEIGYLSTF